MNTVTTREAADLLGTTLDYARHLLRDVTPTRKVGNANLYALSDIKRLAVARKAKP